MTCPNHRDVELKIIAIKKMINVCNECGRSVAEGSGLFVNRIVSLDNFETHKEMGKPFPNGGYMCRECWKEGELKKVGEQ